MTSVEVERISQVMVHGGNSEGLVSQMDVSQEDSESDGQFFFWARQLKSFMDEKSVIFAGYSEGKFQRILLVDVIKELKDIEFFEAVVAVNVLPQPNFLKVTFNAVSMTEIFADTVASIGGIPIKTVNLNDIPNTILISIANLPPEQIVQCVFPLLKQWGTATRLIQNFIPKVTGGKVQVGASKFEFVLADKVTIFDIPSFVRVFGFKVYLNIRGKPRVCFRCNSGGHLVSECPVKFCSVCRSLKPLQHLCLLSYAAAAKGNGVSSVSPMVCDELLAEEASRAEVELQIGSEHQGVIGKKNEIVVEKVVCTPNDESVSKHSISSDLGVRFRAQGRLQEVGRMRTRSLSCSFGRRAFSGKKIKESSAKGSNKDLQKRKSRAQVSDANVQKAKKKKDSKANGKNGKHVADAKDCGKKEKPSRTDLNALQAGLSQVISFEKQHGEQSVGEVMGEKSGIEDFQRTSSNSEMD